ncbi:MAG: cation transporter [Candidatus Aenigmarchaeota archaeon]|nr:cation transporter [Candidatus Aenigmarchaeota archaeon]
MHSHGKVEKTLYLAIVLTSAYFFVEAVGGYISGSLSLLGDAGHMLQDVFSLFVSLSALKLVERLPTKTKTFGYHRIEALAALLNGALLIVVSAFIFTEGYKRIYSPVNVQSGTVLVVATIGFLINLFVALRLRESKDLNIRSAFLHVATDAVSSLAVIAAALWIRFTGQVIVDPVLGMAIGLLVLVSALSLVKESVFIMLEFTPRNVKFDDVIADIEGTEGVTGTHNIHIWSLCSNVNAIDAHIVTEKTDMNEITRIKKDIKKRLEKYEIKHATLEFECEKCEDSGSLKTYHHH